MGFAEAGQLDGSTGTGSVNMLIEAIVEKIDPVAFALIGGTEPESGGKFGGGIGVPNGSVIGNEVDLPGKVDVPTMCFERPLGAPSGGR